MNKLIKKATLVAIILGTVSAANAGYYYSPIDPAGNLTRSLMMRNVSKCNLCKM